MKLQFCISLFLLSFCLSTNAFAQNILKTSQFSKETNSNGVKIFNVDQKVLKNGKNILKTSDGQFTFTLKKGELSNLKFTSSQGKDFVFQPPVKGNAFSCNDNNCGCSGAKDCQNMIVFSGMKFSSCSCVTTYDENGEISSKVCGCIMQ